MKNIYLIIFLTLGISNWCEAQLNNYKYIIVPKKFEGFKNENEYQTSTLIKYLFVQKGFNAVYDEELPDDLKNNRCLGLLVGLEDQSSMFTTKTVLRLKDCNTGVIMTTMEGKSKIKDYKDAFTEAIRNSFKSFDAINYVYSPINLENGPVTLNFKNDVKKLENDTMHNASKYYKPKSIVKQEATRERQTYKSMEPVESNFKKSEDSEPSMNAVAASSEVLYAQEILNGFQLVDSTPKVVLKMYKSQIPDQYLASSDEKNGVVYFKNNKWYFEYYSNGQQIIEELNIKF